MRLSKRKLGQRHFAPRVEDADDDADDYHPPKGKKPRIKTEPDDAASEHYTMNAPQPATDMSSKLSSLSSATHGLLTPPASVRRTSNASFTSTSSSFNSSPPVKPSVSIKVENISPCTIFILPELRLVSETTSELPTWSSPTNQTSNNSSIPIPNGPTSSTPAKPTMPIRAYTTSSSSASTLPHLLIPRTRGGQDCLCGSCKPGLRQRVWTAAWKSLNWDSVKRKYLRVYSSRFENKFDSAVKTILSEEPWNDTDLESHLDLLVRGIRKIIVPDVQQSFEGDPIWAHASQEMERKMQKALRLTLQKELSYSDQEMKRIPSDFFVTR